MMSHNMEEPLEEVVRSLMIDEGTEEPDKVSIVITVP